MNGKASVTAVKITKSAEVEVLIDGALEGVENEWVGDRIEWGALIDRKFYSPQRVSALIDYAKQCKCKRCVPCKVRREIEKARAL